MIMEYKPEIEQILKRYKAFWNMDIADRAPMRVRFVADSMNDSGWSDAVKTKEGHFAYWENYAKARADLFDDEVPTATLDLGTAFMPGVMGAPIYFSGGTSWEDHIVSDYSNLNALREVKFDRSNYWINELYERAEYFKEMAKDKCAVGIAMLTGGADILAALRGVTESYTDIYENEDEFKELLEICTSAWIAVQKIQFDIVPNYDGGYCDNYGLWTPGRSSYFADDLSTCISPQMYMDVLFEQDSRISSFLERPWLHTHSEEARLIPQFLNLPNLRGIQIVNDAPAGPTFKEILPLAKMVQKAGKCLLLRKYTIEDLQDYIGELSPKGLFIDTQCESLSKAKDIIKDYNAQKFIKFPL